jgi:hypothetical protein
MLYGDIEDGVQLRHEGIANDLQIRIRTAKKRWSGINVLGGTFKRG